MLLVDKPGGMTSHDVVQRVRRIFGQREVGHTGTLDPMATGLMVLTLGRATRLGRFLEAADKDYDGTVVLGRATTTYDAEGETTEEAPYDVTEAQLDEAIASLTGTIDQQVPAFSAVKVDGVRLHERARKNEEVERPTRTVTIASLEATRVALPEIDVRCSVSKGTYIRTLAVQLGEKLGTVAHLSALRRTRVGPHRVDDARTLDDLEGTEAELVTPADALAHMARAVLSAKELEDVRHGRPLTAGQIRALGVEGDAEDPVLLLNPDGSAAAVARLLHDSATTAGLPARDRAIAYFCVLDTPDPEP